MPIIDSSIPPIQIDEYWYVVRKTVEEVFNCKDTSGVDRLRTEILRSKADEQILFYHAEPLDVAADLSGKSPGEEEIKKYNQLVERHRRSIP